MKTDLKRRGTYTLKVGDKEINLLFNMRFWGYLDEAGYKLEDLGQHLTEEAGLAKMLKVLVAIINSAGKSYSLTHKEVWEHTEDEVYDWFEEDINQDILTDMMRAMTSSKIMGTSLDQPNLGKRKGGKKK